MRKIYRMLMALLGWACRTDCPPDVLDELSARDWADLPPYHPAEAPARRGCAR
ncbi:MAG: hypothetical protein P4M09_01270 [Devosia sp.]|nr:hypothetical protein [Devosia sp.]